MKRRSAFVVPAIAAVLAAAIAVLMGPFSSPNTRAVSSLAFEAKFETAGDFYGRFDYGVSGVSQLDAWTGGSQETLHYHGDHDASCGAPTTFRDVDLTGLGPAADYSDMFWHCAPGGDPTKGHIMTALNTFGYQHAWFSPKPAFTGITKVCWDINETSMSSRKWTEVQFVGDADADRYPTGIQISGVWTRGSGGFDLGYTNPEFRDQPGSPSTGIIPQGGTLAGLVDARGIFQWFQNQDQVTATGVGWPGQVMETNPDKATRYKHCIANNPDGATMTITLQTPFGDRVHTAAGQIPQDARRVVFHDANYDPPKADNYDPDFLTWHWDNIQVFTDSDAAVDDDDANHGAADDRAANHGAADDRAANDDAADYHTANYSAANYSAANHDTANHGAADDRATNHHTTNHGAADDRAANHHTTDDRAANHHTTDDRAAEYRAANHHTTDDRAADYRAANHHTTDDRTAKRTRCPARDHHLGAGRNDD